MPDLFHSNKNAPLRYKLYCRFGYIRSRVSPSESGPVTPDIAWGGPKSLSAGVDYKHSGLPLAHRNSRRHSLFVIAALVLCLTLSIRAYPYAVLSHEAIVDAAWSTNIVPLLKQRFPNATPDDLRQAHAYAYGGSIIQDMGYYPYGSKFFSDLAHYVRSGDFVQAMLNDAQDINEYAFAIGAMSHYAADNQGHRLAVNLAVPLLYPELQKKYGSFVTFEDNPVAHVKTEFGFDVLEVAKGRYAPDAYRDFIGCEVAQPLLERAFHQTYGIPLSAVLEHESKAINSYRHDVSKIIPEATKIAWQVRKHDIQQDLPGITQRKFVYNLSRASYQKRWGNDYAKPGTGAKILAVLFRLIPKIGPLKTLGFRTPTPETEKLFEASFNTSLDRYRALLGELGAGRLSLPNDNLDVGADTPPGEYYLNDDTYAQLLQGLAKENFTGLTPELRADIERFYANPSSPNAARRNRKRWAQVQTELAQMKDAALPSSTGSNAAARSN